MKLVSFNMFRTLGLASLPGLALDYIKPEEFALHPHRFSRVLEEADWVLFPEHWQLNTLEYGMGCRIFPSPATYRIGHDKIEITRACHPVFPDNLPQTWIGKNTTEEAERLWQELATPFVAKLPKASQGNGVWLINSRREWWQYLGQTDRIYVQEYLPIDRDLRIVRVGGEIIAAYWRHQSDRSFHNNVAQGGLISYGDIPDAAIALVQNLGNRLDINHAGFDIAMVNDRPYLLEFNRLFGNQGVPGGGKTITDAMVKFLEAVGDDNRPVDPDRPKPARMQVA